MTTFQWAYFCYLFVTACSLVLVAFLYNTSPTENEPEWEGATEGWSPSEGFTEPIDTTLVILETIVQDYREASFAAIDEAIAIILEGDGTWLSGSVAEASTRVLTTR